MPQQPHQCVVQGRVDVPTHLHQEQRQGKDQRQTAECTPLAEVFGPLRLGEVCGRVDQKLRRVTRIRCGLRQSLPRHRADQMANAGGAFGQIHLRLDHAGLGAKQLLQPPHAGGAAHPLELQFAHRFGGWVTCAFQRGSEITKGRRARRDHRLFRGNIHRSGNHPRRCRQSTLCPPGASCAI